MSAQDGCATCIRANTPVGKAGNEAALRTNLVIALPRPPLRTRPAIVDEVEDGAVDVVELDFVSGIVAVVGFAHDPAPPGLLDQFLCRLDIVHPDPEMMQPDEVSALSLRRLVRFVMQQ